MTTVAAHRGRGLATLACAALIGMCEAEGLAPWWDCAAHNMASVRLAWRLGFGAAQPYRYCWWEATHA
ncbi:MAG: GNAT family N-acetyltransferase [Blastochloris sp.]|nr:GNAT family N-acetyltransferase [Blastochloris sp.]